jgi:carboxylesterase
MAKIIPGAEPFFFPGGDVGCLLVHGLTGTPFEMRELGEYLSAQGYTVSGPRLAGHGTTDWRDLANAKWENWYRTVVDAYNDLAAWCQRVYLIGLSAGGALALYHCATYRGESSPAGCIAMAVPAFYYSPSQASLLNLLSHIVPYLRKGKSRIKDPEARRTQITGLHLPLATGVQFHRFLDNLRPKLVLVRQPTLLIYSHQDPTVALSNGEYILSALGATEKTLEVVENSYHILTRDYDKRSVFQSAASFLTRR